MANLSNYWIVAMQCNAMKPISLFCSALSVCPSVQCTYVINSSLTIVMIESFKVAVLLGASEKEAEVEMEEVTQFMLKFGQLCNKHIFIYAPKSEIPNYGLQSLSSPSVETVEEMGKKYPEVSQHFKPPS